MLVYKTIPSKIYRKSNTDQIDVMEFIDHEVDTENIHGKIRRIVPTTVTRKEYNATYLPTTYLPKVDKWIGNECSNLSRLYSYSYHHDGYLYSIEDFSNMYDKYEIPKKSGGMRTISEPTDAWLLVAQDRIKMLLEKIFPKCGYHANAYAYVQGRNILNCLHKHQANKSRWFLKLDFHDFFGSTDIDTVMTQLKKLSPLAGCNVWRMEDLKRILKICFLNGGLPQGTVVSPMLTNLIMIPFDYEISKVLREKGFVYTRYADDILISHEYPFKFSEIKDLINKVLSQNEYKYTLNDKKTRYGNINGRNWNLGLMLNKDNEITIGWEKKKIFKAELTNFIARKKNWDKSPIKCGDQKELRDKAREINGLIAYYRMIDRNYTDYVIEKLSSKFEFDIIRKIKEII